MVNDTHLDDELDLTTIIDQMFGDDMETAPAIDSKYFDLEELRTYHDDNNLNNAELACIHMNIRSLPDKFDKLQLLLSELHEINIHFDCILMSETFLNNNNNTM